MKVVIMAGGKGTRIASINSEVPKPMITILNKPILEYEIESLRNQGYTDFIIVVGHLGNVIKEYFGDGSRFKVTISYITEEEPLGTAGALFYLKDEIKDDFLLMNGDIIADVDVGRFYKFHKEKGGLVTLFTHPNSHPYDSGIIVADEDKKVTNWLHKEDGRLWYRNRVNAGLHMISPKIFESDVGMECFRRPIKIDLDRDVLKPLITTGELYVYDSPEYVKDMGTPERLYMVCDDVKNDRVTSKNLINKQKAVFLDRDGTINRYVGFLTNIEQFELLDGVAEAIKMLNNMGYLVIVITNQPVIARGEVTSKELHEIHNKMETLLGVYGAYVNDIYYCPHHPDKGYEGEIAEYKVDCDCRKPKPGLILKAAKDYNIDISNSWMVGDSIVDIQTGKNAGCKTAYIGGKTEGVETENSFESLLEFTKQLVGDYDNE